MQYITKQLSMPTDVENWIKKNQPKTWELGKDYHDGYVLLREQLRQEQKGLCCYCCQILETQATVEHLKSRSKFPQLTFDYQNLLLSCQESNQCDNAKGNNELELTPLMIECDIEITLKVNGELNPKSKRAEQAINLLNLNNIDLCQRRKVAIDNLFSMDNMLSQENLELMFGCIEYEQAEFYRYVLNKLVLNGYS
ncbi:TIGR02646 family protein [Moraxella porci DSM 25326]|uniref:TIGR02646 family protein n=1 Tax=Moraxella porci DSM 25326 TaxID=573983 RepID=A0A1T0CUN2_9GAMM|nr:retron system putative HNH endonuclease [Moraxella porci]OOS25841.1 TIGR02646 family protein [Moraxella porci DSM 25326]